MSSRVIFLRPNASVTGVNRSGHSTVFTRLSAPTAKPLVRNANMLCVHARLAAGRNFKWNGPLNAPTTGDRRGSEPPMCLCIEHRSTAAACVRCKQSEHKQIARNQSDVVSASRFCLQTGCAKQCVVMMTKKNSLVTGCVERKN